jgi:hypothetical protein
LDYASAAAVPVPALDSLTGLRGFAALAGMVLATAAFAVAHWTTEYACQYVYHDVANATYQTYEGRQALKGFDNDMLAETATIILCSPLFLAVQFILRPRRRVRTRRFTIAVAGASGVAFCLIRWGRSLALGLIPESLNLVFALLLAAALAVGVSFYRGRGGPPTSSR